MDAIPMSPNCRAAQGQPHRTHVCSGCPGCACHHVPAPEGFRELVYAARERAEHQHAPAPEEDA